MAVRYATRRSPLVLDRLLVRLVPSMVVQPIENDHFPELLPGLTAVPAMPDGDDVVLVTDEHLAAPLGGPSTLYERAREQLRRRPARTTPVPLPDTQQSYWQVSGDEFVSGRLGMITDYLPEPWRGQLPSTGIVVAVPRASLMLVYVPHDAGIVDALHAISDRTSHEYQNGPDPVAPFVYYVSPEGHSQQLTDHSGDGLQLVVQGPFKDIYQQLAPSGHDADIDNGADIDTGLS